MTVGVYGIFDRDTNTCLYVGMSANIEQRWNSHMREIKGGRHRRKGLVDWSEEFGFDSLIFVVIEECENDDKLKNALEIKWFNNLKPKFYGKKPSMNDTWVHSEETKRKIGNAAVKNHEALGTYEKRECHCGTVFRVTKKLTSRKSCDGCLAAGKRAPRMTVVRTTTNTSKSVERTCEHCQKVFETVESGRKFCSHECSSNSNIIPLDKDELYKLYWEQNLSLGKIAEIKGLNRQTVFNNLKRFGIPSRGKNDFHNL